MLRPVQKEFKCDLKNELCGEGWWRVWWRDTVEGGVDGKAGVFGQKSWR